VKENFLQAKQPRRGGKGNRRGDLPSATKTICKKNLPQWGGGEVLGEGENGQRLRKRVRGCFGRLLVLWSGGGGKGVKVRVSSIGNQLQSTARFLQLVGGAGGLNWNLEKPKCRNECK